MRKRCVDCRRRLVASIDTFDKAHRTLKMYIIDIEPQKYRCFECTKKLEDDLKK